MLEAVPASPASASLWDEAFLAQTRRDMTRFADLQLRDRAAAEDAVQEALAEALAGAGRFSGRAALKTWIFAILRHKIVDTLRSRRRSINISSLVSDDEASDDFDALFDHTGHWQADEAPRTWQDPEASLAQQQFWAVFEACLNRLPDNTARVFMMREHLGFETEEICNELAITANNCWVILHRARLQLRICLEKNWFAGEATPC